MPYITTIRNILTPLGKAKGIGLGSTGGVITTSGGYRIHTFTTAGSATFYADNPGVVEYLIVGAGGSSGVRHGGGGGGGGLLTGSIAISAGNKSISVADTTVSITGGSATSAMGQTIPTAQNSTALGLTAYGGGHGGTYGDSGYSMVNATSGGSGGGSPYAGAAGTGTVGQGNNGAAYGPDVTGGGGGGAGANASGPNGGAGLLNSLDGNAYYYAGGAGGSNWNSTTVTVNGGIGGGGAGQVADAAGSAANGTGGGSARNSGSTAARISNNGVLSKSGSGGANTGGGGGGCGQGAYQSYNAQPGNGGSGIVIIRYAL